MIQVQFPTKTLSHNKPAISKVGVTTPRCFRHQHHHRQGTNKLITAKGFTFFGSGIGDSYKSSLGTGTWRGPHPKHISYSIHTVTKHQICTLVCEFPHPGCWLITTKYQIRNPKLHLPRHLGSGNSHHPTVLIYSTAM